jgi:hypothetical protein
MCQRAPFLSCVIAALTCIGAVATSHKVLPSSMQLAPLTRARGTKVSGEHLEHSSHLDMEETWHVAHIESKIDHLNPRVLLISSPEHASMHRNADIGPTWLRVQAREPLLSMTMDAPATLLSIGICAATRARASSSVKPLRCCRRSSCCEGLHMTTMTSARNLSVPVSNSSGMSITCMQRPG